MWHIYHVEWKNDLASGDESGAAARLAAWIVATWRGGGVFEARSSTEATSLLWSLGQYDAARLLGLRLSQSSPPAVASSSLGHPAVDTGDFADASFDSAETTPLLGSATDEWNEYVRKEAASAAAAAAAAETVSTARPVVIALRHKMHLGVPSVAHVAAFRTAAAMAENSALTFASITAESIGMDGLVRFVCFSTFRMTDYSTRLMLYYFRLPSQRTSTRRAAVKRASKKRLSSPQMARRSFSCGATGAGRAVHLTLCLRKTFARSTPGRFKSACLRW